MSKQPQEKEGLLDKKQPPITRLNKKTVLLLVGVVCIVIAVILVLAFSPSNQNSARSNTIKTESVNASQARGLKSLPQGYQDAKQIQHLLTRGQKPQQLELPKAVREELDALRASQASLKSQLAQLQAQPKRPPQQPSSPLDREAMTSAIFFSGGAPEPLSKAEQDKQAKAEKDKAKASGQSADKGSDYEKQNMQKQKLDFLNGKPDKDIYNQNSVQYPPSKYILQAGTVIPAILQTKIVSNLPGNVVAIVRSNVYDSIVGRYLLIPKGSKLMGEYSSNVSYGQDQVQVKFTRLIRPDGSSVVLPNQQGVNDMGVSGLKDDVDNHWGQIIGSGVLSALFNIPSIVATNQMYTTQNCSGDNCVTPVGTLARASAIQSIGQSASQIGQQIAQRSLNLQPTIIIHSGFTFSVMVNKDIILPKYKPMLRGAQ